MRLPSSLSRGILASLALLAAGPGPALAQTAVPASVYDRAAQFLPDNQRSLVWNESIQPHWRRGGRERFTYLRALGDGRGQFIEVDAETGKRKIAFDHAGVARGLSAALGRPVEAERLPFTDYDELKGAIGFDALGKAWICSTSTARCDGAAAPAQDPKSVPSPDGKWAAYIENHNLWVRSADGQTRFALTTDGQTHFAYGAATEVSIALASDGRLQPLTDADGRRIGLESPPVLAWSPDSRRILIHRLDERKVREMPIVQSTPQDGTVRPVVSLWRMAMPNDPALPTVESWVFDLASRKGLRLSLDAQPIEFATPIEARDAWWSDDNRQIYVIVRSRYHKAMSLYAVDPETGLSRLIITETGKTFVESGSNGERPMVYVLRNRDVVWFSERDGWASLYLYDGASGALKRRLTSTGWTVRNVLKLDEARGEIFVAGNEREPGVDPYYRDVYRVGLRDGRIDRLTHEEGDHWVRSAQESTFSDRAPFFGREPEASRGFSPSGRFFLETVLRTDAPSRTVLHRSDGGKIVDIETADITRLKALGYTPPERFRALAADNQTVLYGTLFRPSNFDPTRRYPIIDAPYPGPQSHRTRIGLEATVFDYGQAQAYAELGFITFTVDGRGTHGRSKAFHDESYGQLAKAGHLDDHVAVIRQLARRYPYIDADRVGIYGCSGGGYATLRALLTYPDIFKVGVADAGNHDQRGYISIWGEVYNGPENGSNYSDSANAPLAKNLKGKLLLTHGDMDTNVSPSLTLQVVDSLIKANRTFDLLITPNAGHCTLWPHSYGMRRAWDYFVENLMGATPPVDYDPARRP